MTTRGELNYSISSNLSIADRSHGLLWVVFDDGRLMDKDVFLGVIPVDEPIAGLDVEPLDGAGDFGGNHLLGYLLHLLVSSSLLLVGLGLRVSHDGNVVLMVT